MPTPTTEGETPRTEAVKYITALGIMKHEYGVSADFARVLERELNEATIQLTALTAANAEMKVALKPFANLDISSADGLKHKNDRPVFGLNHTHFTVGDVRRARALMALHQSAPRAGEEK